MSEPAMQLSLPEPDGSYPPKEETPAKIEIVRDYPAFQRPLVTKLTHFERFAPYVNYASCTPARVAQVLKGTQRNSLRDFADLCTYMLETDAHIQSLYDTRKAQVLQTQRAVQPVKSDDPLEQRIAADQSRWIDAVWSNIVGLKQALNQALSSIGFGHSVHEICLKREKNYWTIDRFHFVPLRRFTFGEDYQLQLYDNGLYGAYGKPLRPGTVNRETMSIIFVHTSPAREGYPDRWALFRVNVWNWCLKVWLTKFWMSAAERFGNPLLLGKVGPNATPEVRTALKSALESLSSDHAGIVEGETTIEMLKGEIQAGSTFEALMRFLDSRDSKAIVGSTLNTELQQVGSFAAAQSQATETIDPRAVMDGDRLEDDIRLQIWHPLLALNSHLWGGASPMVPTWVPMREGDTAIEPWMLQSGVRITHNQVRQQAGLEKLPEGMGGEDFVTPSTPAVPMFSDQTFGMASGGELADIPLSRSSLPMKGLTQPTISSSRNPLDRVYARS